MKNRGRAFAFLFAASLLLAPPAVHALEVPDKPSGYVNDYAGLLTASTRQELENALSDFDKNTSTQILVALFPSLEGEALEDFTQRLIERWRPGSGENPNGVILAVFKNDRAVRIEVGYGLEGALPDALAFQIIHQEILPAFAGGDFDGGVARGAAAIMRATRGEYTAAPKKDPFQAHAPAAFFLFILAMMLPPLGYALIIGYCMFVLGPGPGFITGVAISFVLFIFHRLLSKMNGGQTFSGRPPRYWSGTGGGFGGGSGSGGGFSGGGFTGGHAGGGGGASGRW